MESRSKGRLVFEAWPAAAGASIQLGESAQAAGEPLFEEVFESEMPVSEVEEVVEQTVQGEGIASQGAGFEPPYQNSQRQE